MASKDARIISVLILRIFTLLLLAASIVLMATNNFKLSDGTKMKFTDLIAYRYVLASAGVGFLYTLIQIPFAFYHVIKEKRLIRNSRFAQEFDFYGDKIISFLLASGVGVGFGVSFEFRRNLNDFLDLVQLLEQLLDTTGLDGARSKARKYLDRGIIATGVLLAAFVCMAVLTKLTSKPRKR